MCGEWRARCIAGASRGVASGGGHVRGPRVLGHGSTTPTQRAGRPLCDRARPLPRTAYVTTLTANKHYWNPYNYASNR